MGTCTPTSTTRSWGKAKKRAAFAAFRCMNANRCSRHLAIEGSSVTITDSFPRK